jgi:hypothetical protein
VGTHCFVCKKELGTFTARGSKKWIIEQEGKPPENMGDKDVLCNDCLEPIREEKKHNLPIIKTSAALWLLPIFLGLMGGIIMYAVTRNRDKQKAKNGLFLGIGVTILSFILYGSVI